MISLTLPVLLLILGRIRHNDMIAYCSYRVLYSHINTKSKVTGHVGPEQLKEAIQDAAVGK